MNSPFMDIPHSAHRAALALTKHLSAKGFVLVRMHAYTDKDGVPTWYVLRFKNGSTGKKEIRPLRCASSEFELKRPEFGKEGVPLYRLHKLYQYPEEIVYLVEGEACAEWLEGLGFVATTWANGANAVGRADFQPLAARKVVTLRDFDEAGECAMQSACAILRSLGATVLSGDVSALGLQVKGDIRDWLERFVAGHGKQHLHEIADGVELAREAVEALPLEEWKVAA